MSITGEDDAPPVSFRGATGDHAAALNILAAVLAALRLRDRDGEGQHVEVTLQATGMWTIGIDLAFTLVTNEQPAKVNRRTKINPISNSTYRCADGRWILLANPTPFPRAWPRFCAIAGRPDWIVAYDDLPKLRAAAPELAVAIEAIVATHDAAWWAERLDGAGLIWAPVATLPEVIADPQVREMGWITTVESPILGAFETLATPFKIYGADIGPRGPAPELGHDTSAVLGEWGLGEDEVQAFAMDGVLG